jgi:hypothetical protein
MQAAEFADDTEDRTGLYKEMVVIRQYAPGADFATQSGQECQQLLGKRAHALGRRANDRTVLVAGGSEMIEPSVVLSVRRTVPG